MEDLSQLYQTNPKEAEKVHFSDADFDQDFRVDPLTTMDAVVERYKEKERIAKERLQQAKTEKEEQEKLKAQALEEEQYIKFKERHQKDQETALNSHKDEHG